MALPATYCKATLVTATPQKSHLYNVFYYKPAAAPTFTSSPMADAVTLANAVMAKLVTSLGVVLTDSSIISGLNLDLIVSGNSYDVSVIDGDSGSVSADELATFEAVVIQKRTASPGKSGRGRWYLGGVPETLTDENYLILVAIGYYEAVAADWIADVTALGVSWEAQLYSKKLSTLTKITSKFVDPKIGSIGGRKSHSIL